jgi:hypothetical protein
MGSNHSLKIILEYLNTWPYVRLQPMEWQLSLGRKLAGTKYTDKKQWKAALLFFSHLQQLIGWSNSNNMDLYIRYL